MCLLPFGYNYKSLLLKIQVYFIGVSRLLLLSECKEESEEKTEKKAVLSTESLR